ncbi:Arylsulfatase A [Salegentibacter agarivorans]|uniref:Arylsulfatase A n=1 Tax=Salegentibacter agarivorans TaxID=345907 RepID=A0A1I2KMC8_9FLAO|nr:sulfatase [Salegentibacter agarivorans]SFF68152.1 Arylsulfatase A [Salegentibacter agarivorans]
MHKKNIKPSLLFFFFMIMLSAKSQEIGKQPPNIVWIVSEDNSKHYLKLFDDNGVETPNIANLAEEGILFTRAFSNAPVCSVARSTIISGSYAPRIGAQYHRKSKIVPMPDSIDMFPAYLRKAGYYTTNNSKEDYNLIKGEDVWDDSSKNATWKNREKGQPFFHVFNIGTTHESGIHFQKEDIETIATVTSEASFKVQPTHPETKIFKYTNARYRDKMIKMDKEVGQVVQELEKEGLLENTFIFYYGDHGGVLPGSKGYLYETGLHVPLVVRIPKKYKNLVNWDSGSKTGRFVSFVDLAPTVLHLAGVNVPRQMDGRPFLSNNLKHEIPETQTITYAYADRFDEKYDMVRSIRKGKYKYIRNFQPFNPDALMNEYRYKQLAYKQWKSLYEQGKLNKIQAKFFQPKAAEMLFDLEKDPYETNNLAKNSKLKHTLIDLRKHLDHWMMNMPDLSFYPEYHLLEHAVENPVAFGQQHKQDIIRYHKVSQLMLQNFSGVKHKLESYLQSKDPWERYWALIVCSSFRKKAKTLTPLVKSMAAQDPKRINRVRAAQFLGLIKKENPAPVMLDALYATDRPMEALLILNMITVLNSQDLNYNFFIDPQKIDPKVLEEQLVAARIKYLNN